MDAETFLIDHLAEIERVIAFVCRRNALWGADAEDFGSLVKLKIIDNDYAIIRKFESRCSFHAYLVIVIQRILLDERNHAFGKWRPSAEAQRLGEIAVRLETHLLRDHRTLDEAMELIRGSGTVVTRRELEELAKRLPARKTRPRPVPLDASANAVAISGDTVSAHAEAGEREAKARKVATVLQRAVERLPDRERLIFRLRFEADMSVAEIARALRIQQKPIYRLLAIHLKKLRRALEREGIEACDVDDIVGLPSTPLDRGLADSQYGATPPVGKD